MGVLLTQAVGLGFVISPLWGSPAHSSPLRRGKTDYARRRVRTVFSFSEGEKVDRDWRSHQPSRAG